MNFTIFMNPVAKGRARTCVRGEFVHSYTPAKTKDAEEIIKQAIFDQHGIMAGQGYFSKGIPLRVDLAFYITKPKSVSKKRIYHTVKSDLDNYCKLVFDALNGRLFEDDSQIVELHATKAYGSPARIEIDVMEVKHKQEACQAHVRKEWDCG